MSKVKAKKKQKVQLRDKRRKVSEKKQVVSEDDNNDNDDVDDSDNDVSSPKKIKKKYNLLGYEFKSIVIRTAPSPFAKVMSSLNISQKKMVCEMGFGSLLGFSISELNPKLGHYVVSSFNGSSIKTLKGKISCNRDAVFQVFGISKSVGVRLSSLKKSTEFEKVWEKQFKNPKLITSKDIANAMISDAADHMFKMNFLMLFYNTMIACESGGHVCKEVLKYIKEDTKVDEIDWCGELLEVLKVSKNRWNPENPLQSAYSGPYTFLYVSKILF